MSDLIDIRSWSRKVLKALIQDHSTGLGIMWAADIKASDGTKLRADGRLATEFLLGLDPCEVQPRALKSRSEQAERTKKKAEVFTPAWLCNKMNNYCDAEWFGREGVFNVEEGQDWQVNSDPVHFDGGRDWRKYVASSRLEITCGEAPFLVSRYDSAAGSIIPLERRIGIFDRKMRVVNENAGSRQSWLKWAFTALQSVYGYEFQGDSLLIARVNLLTDFCEYVQARFGGLPSEKEALKAADIISRNIWQMDGLTGEVPYGRPSAADTQADLFAFDDESEPAAVQCRIFRNGNKEPVLYQDIKEQQDMKFDFVIGNPPYQEETAKQTEISGQVPVKNLFHYFQIEADKVANLASILVYPGGRWIHRFSKGISDFGLRQINDIALQCVYFYPNTADVFPSAGIADGISVVIKNRTKNKLGFDYVYCSNGREKRVSVENPGQELMPLDPDTIVVCKKLNAFVSGYNLNFLHDSICPRSLFGIESDFVEKNPNAVRNYNKDEAFNEVDEIKLLTNDKAGKSGRAKWYIANRSVIEKNKEYIDQWKVIVSSANAGGQKRDNQLEIADNHSAFGRARVALASFTTKEEAEHFFKYVKSYVIRFAFLMTDESLTTLGKKVPNLGDYTSNSKIIDFSSDIDTQLCKLMGLSQEEFSYVRQFVDNFRVKGAK